MDLLLSSIGKDSVYFILEARYFEIKYNIHNYYINFKENF